MYCRNCGQQMEDMASFCTHCGAGKGTGNAYCPNCGNAVDPNAVVCVKCGVALNNMGGQFNPGYQPGPQPGPGPQNGYNPNAAYPGRPLKSKLAAGLLGIFLGGFGVHSFYLGFAGKGVAQIIVTLVTCGVGSLWGFIEGILILTGNISRDADGNPLAD